MKRFILTSFSSLLLSAGSLCAFNLNWDYCDETWFLNRNYSTPWGASSEGVSVVSTGCDEIQKDWELYDRQLDPSDNTPLNYLDVPDVLPATGLLPTTKDGSHWFSLYNRKAGVLRTFMYIYANLASNTSTKGQVILNVTESGSLYKNHSYFSYDGPEPIYLLANRAASSLAQPVYTIPFGKQKKWVIVDTYLSYEPTIFKNTYASHKPFFHYQYKTFGEMEITLAGTQTVKNEQPTGSENIFGTTANFVSGAFKGFTSVTDGIGKSDEAITGTGKFLKDHGYTKQGDALTAIAGKIAPYTTYLGLAMGGSSIISSFIVGPNGSQISYPSYDINLKGMITQVGNPENAYIPIASATMLQKNYYAKKYASSPNEELGLGLVTLTTTPTYNAVWVPKAIYYVQAAKQYRVGWDLYLNLNDIASKIILNPTSGAKFKSLKVWFEEDPSVWDFEQNTTVDTYGWGATPIRNMKGYWIDVQQGKSLYVGKYYRFYSGEVIGSNSGTISPLYKPKITSSIPIKLLFTLEVAPGQIQEISKNISIVPNKTTMLTIPTQSSYPTLTQTTVSSSILNDRITVAQPVDPVANIITRYSQGGSLSYSGRANWYTRSDANGTYAVNGYIGNNSTASLVFTMPGGVYFQWKTSSENYGDKLELFVDGIQTSRSIMGITDWETVAYYFPDWNWHTVEIRYTKDYSLYYGEDRAFVRNIQEGS